MWLLHINVFFGNRVCLVSAEIIFDFVFFRCTHFKGAIKHLLNSEPNQLLRCGGSRWAENICKHTCTADTHNGYFANCKTLSFDNKAPAKGDVFAAIAEFVFHWQGDSCLAILVHDSRVGLKESELDTNLVQTDGFWVALDRLYCSASAALRTIRVVLLAAVESRCSERSSWRGRDHRMVAVQLELPIWRCFWVRPEFWACRTEWRFLWLSGMTRGDDGSTRCINLPRCARTTQLKSPLWVALLVFFCWIQRQLCGSRCKLLVNRWYCNMCIDVPESTTAKCEPGNCCTCECSTIRQVCV